MSEDLLQSLNDDLVKIERKENDILREEIERLKQGICEHIAKDELNADCYFCNAAIAIRALQNQNIRKKKRQIQPSPPLERKEDV